MVATNTADAPDVLPTIEESRAQDDDEDSERELISREITTTEIEFDVEDETEEPKKKEKSLPQIVSDVITRMF